MAVVEPTIRFDRRTSILHEKVPVTELTVKVTNSAGIPWLASCGLYGSSVASTEVTFAGKARGAADNSTLVDRSDAMSVLVKPVRLFSAT